MRRWAVGPTAVALAATFAAVLPVAAASAATKTTKVMTKQCGGPQKLAVSGVSCAAAAANLAKDAKGFTCAQIGQTTTAKCVKQGAKTVFYTYFGPPREVTGGTLSCVAPPPASGATVAYGSPRSEGYSCATALAFEKTAPTDLSITHYTAEGLTCTSHPQPTAPGTTPTAVYWDCVDNTTTNLIIFDEDTLSQ